MPKLLVTHMVQISFPPVPTYSNCVTTFISKKAHMQWLPQSQNSETLDQINAFMISTEVKKLGN